MKEHKSHMSMVARFAYIFATIVTVFAQMGAAVPAMITDASTTNADPTGMTITEVKTIASENPNVSTHILEINGPHKPADQSSFTVNLLGSMQNLFYDKTDQLNSADMSGVDTSVLGDVVSWVGSFVFGLVGGAGNTSNTVQYVSAWRMTPNADGTAITVNRNDAYRPAVGSFSKDVQPRAPWPMFIAYSSDSSKSAGMQVNGSDTPIVLSENNTLNLSVVSNGPTTYKVGDEVDLQVSDQDMIDGGEVDVAKDDVSQYLQFDYDKTVALLKKQGYTQANATVSDITNLAEDANTASQISKFTGSDGKYFYVLNSNGDGHIVWPPSDAKSQRTAMVAMDAVGKTDDVALQSAYLNGFLRKKGDYLSNELHLTIKPAAKVDGSGMRLDAHSVGKNNKAGDGPYQMSDFPLFYMTDKADNGTDLYSFIYNNQSRGVAGTGSATGSLEKLRKGILYDKSSYSALSGAKETTNDGPAFFENFNTVKADGSVDTTKQQGFEPDKTYSLIPYNQAAGSDHFIRIPETGVEGHDYYMPDGVPTFKVNDSGNISLVTTGDGNAIPGQWSASGKDLNVALYKIKKVEVVDQNGDFVPDAKLTLNQAGTSTATMKATTTEIKNDDGTVTDKPGELVLNSWNDATKDAFYYPNVDQDFGSLSLPDGYSQTVAFKNMKLSSDDTLSLGTGAKDAEVVDNGQTLKLKVWKHSDADSQVNIKKIDATTKDPLAGANFTVEETGNNTSDALKSGTTYTSGDDGMVSGISVDPDSAAKTRTFHITETKAPDKYQVANKDGYDVTWTKGTGFTSVLKDDDTQGDASSDGVVSIDKGTLVFADSKLLFDGGGDSGMKFEYVDHAGNPIAGAQLPTLEEDHLYQTTSADLGINGIGGVIYNPKSDPETLKTADSGLVAGTGLKDDSSMATSTEKSDADGMGIIQGLWSQLGIRPDWESLGDTSGAAYILSHAIEKNFLPETPAIVYGLYNEKQQARVQGTQGSDYYSMGSQVQILGDSKSITVAMKPVKTLRDNLITTDTAKNAAVVTLYKVKHVAIRDANNQPVVGATVRFTNLVTAKPTDGNGEADLVPADSKGNPTTNFAFPAGTQKFISAKDSEGNDLALGDNATTFGTWIDKATDDNLVKSGSASNITISDGSNADHAAGQYVELKTTTAQTKTVIRIHKESALNADTPVQGVTFHVWKADDESTAVQTPKTDENGDTTATFDTASGNGNYVIKEDTLPTDVLYKQDTQEHTFSADDTGKVTGVKAGETVITPDTDGALHFADMPNGGGGGIGDNGTNGGDLTIKKIDKADGSTVQSDATQFTVTQTLPSNGYSETKGTKDGAATFSVGEATTADKVFKIVESHAPDGYADNTKSYLLRVQKDGTMTLADSGTLNTDIVDDHTADGTINFVSAKDHTLLFGDDKVTTGNNGGLFSLQKLDAANPTQALSGATFSLDEVGTTGINNVGGDTTTGTDGKLSFDLGQSTNVTRYFKLIERTAPLGYTLNTKIYAIQITADGTVTIAPIDSNSKANSYNSDDPGASYKAMQTVTFTNASPNGTVTVNGKGVTFLDSKTGTANNGTLTFKKVDNADRTQGLAGAKFGFGENINTRAPEYNGHEEPDDSDPTKVNFIPNYYDSGADGTVTVGLDGATNSTRMIDVGEAAAPTGYAASTNQYRIYIDPAGKYTVSQKANGSWSTPAATTTDGVLQVDANNNLTFGDTKVASAGSFAIKKVDSADRTKAITTNLNNASFDVTDVSDATTKANYLVGSTGVTSDIPTTKSTSDLHLLKIQEKAAPGGYDLNSKEYYVVVSSTKGVVGISDAQDTNKTTSASSDGVVSVDSTDKHTVIFGDTKQTNSFSMKKTDASDQTTPVTGNATFTVSQRDADNQPIGKQFTVNTTNGDITSTTLQDQTLTSGNFLIQETTPPSDQYEREVDNMYFSWSADKGVTAVGQSLKSLSATPAKDPHGITMMKIDQVNGKGVLNYSDVKKTVATGNGLVIKKVSSTDTTKGLAGATFTIQTVTPGTTATVGTETTTVTTDDQGIATYTPADTTGRQYFRVEETSAPSGYDKAPSPFFVLLTDGKLTNYGMERATVSDVKPQAANYLNANMVDGQLVVQDTPKPVIRIKKVSSVTGQTLAGAKLAWAETDANGQAFTPAEGADAKQDAGSFTTLGDGIAEFTPTAKIVGSTHYYRISEDTAPTGYSKGVPTVIAYKVGTGIIGVKPADTTPLNATQSGPLTVTSEKVNGYLNVIKYTDEPLSYSLHVRRQAQKGTSSTPAYLGIGETAKVYIQKADGTGNQYQVPVTNDYKIKNSDLAKGLGLASMPTSGSVVLKISVDPSSVPDYTVPAPRTVNFNWGPNGGFTQIKADNDGMVTDSINSQQPDASNKMASGDLRLLVRRDTLIAKNSGTLTDQDSPLIKNASFTLNYYLSPVVTSGMVPIATQVVQTNENGVALIKEPSALLKSSVALNSMLTVQVSQTPDQQTSGYELFKDPVTLTYFSGTGFSLFTGATDGIDPQYLAVDGSKDPYIDDATVGTDTATGLITSTYNFGGSQITVPLTKIINNLTLNSAPKVMNFGHAQVLSGAQQLDLLPGSTDDDPATKPNLEDFADFAGTKPLTDDTKTDDGDFLNAQVTQVGTYKSGWQLKLAMSTLTSEDGSDPISGGSVTMGTAKVTRDSDTTDLNMGMNKTVDMDGIEPVAGETMITDYNNPQDLVNTGDNSIAGVYNIAWDVNNVKMNLPAMVGKLNTNYRSTMAWALTWAP